MGRLASHGLGVSQAYGGKMTTTRQWLIILLLFSAGAFIGYWLGRPAKSDCAALAFKSAVSIQAAEMCTTQLVGCGLTYADLKAILVESEAAKGCK